MKVNITTITENILSPLSGSDSLFGEREDESTKEENLMRAWSPSERARRQRVESGATVTANIKTDMHLIEWAQATSRFVRICRGTRWGNPYVIDQDGDRKTVIESYRSYIARKIGLLKQLSSLRGKVLGCWCHPEQCHGDELIRLIEGIADEHAPC